MFARSLVLRLISPLGILVLLVLAIQALDARVRARVAEAQDVVAHEQATVFELAELRSVSRSLQREVLNLSLERDPAALVELRARFDRRHRDFTRRLALLGRTAPDGELRDYFATQRAVLAELQQARTLSERDRSAAYAAFREKVRPAERHASVVADALIDRRLSGIATLRQRVAALDANETRTLAILSIILTAIALAVACYVILVTVLRPLADIRRAMETLAAGDATIAVPHVGRRDAIGAMARSIEVFRAAAQERDRLRDERAQGDQRDREQASAAEAQRSLDAQRRVLLAELAAAVDSSLSSVNDTLRRSADRLLGSAQNVATQAGITGSEADLTAQAARSAATELLAVTSATTQLAETVDALRRQAREAAGAVGRAATRSRAAGARIASLTASADQVAQLAEMIRAVAARSRMLALNATIEAARVGEAGRGFAVVAGEMKTLATQTAEATHQVDRQAQAIRATALEATGVLDEIDQAVGQIEQDAARMTTAMEQQGSASVEIGDAMRSAFTLVDQVETRMADLRRTAAATDSVAGTLQSDSAGLAADASSVDHALRDLVASLRAAA